MVFCGQCGFHLPTGVTRCPRCGTVSNTQTNESDEQVSTDSPTVASLTYLQTPQANSRFNDGHPSAMYELHDPQKLVLHSENNAPYGYDVAMDNEPTSAINQADYRTRPQVPVDYPTNSPYSTTPSLPPYPLQQGGMSSNSGYPHMPTPYSGNLPPGGATPYAQQPTPPIQQRKSRRWPVFFAVLLLLIVLGASAFFVVQRLHLRQITGSNGATATPVLSPVDSAKRVVQNYYTDVNNKDYQSAYNLWQWQSGSPSYTTFKNGYANTEHDVLTIHSATHQIDGTVKVLLTIVATERTTTGTQYHTYAGYYIVGLHDGSWKILRGILNPI